MIKMILIAALAATLTGCGWYERKVVANITGYSKTCVEGVTYLQFSSGVTPQLTVDGRPVACE
jgi:hypothetical protein